MTASHSHNVLPNKTFMELLLMVLPRGSGSSSKLQTSKDRSASELRAEIIIKKKSFKKKTTTKITNNGLRMWACTTRWEEVQTPP